MNKETPIPRQQRSLPSTFITYAKTVTPHKNEHFHHRLHAPDRGKYLKKYNILHRCAYCQHTLFYACLLYTFFFALIPFTNLHHFLIYDLSFLV